MKVLWICKFSNSQVRKELNLSVNFFETFLRKLLKMPQKQWDDYASWITNGIEEFEKFNGIELHVVSPHYGMVNKNETFHLNGINYHFFKPDADTVSKRVRRIFSKDIKSKHKGNRKAIKSVVSRINPDIIHMYGAENPMYSLAALDIDTKKFPLFVSLQTLMSEPGFYKNYFITKQHYIFRAGIEKDIIKRVKYIGSSVPKYRDFVWSELNSHAIFFKTFLAVEQKVISYACEKKYDFVFFAVSIEKLADVAVEAFAVACKKYPQLTLNIIGGTPEPFTSNLKFRIKELGIEKNVVFSGKLPEHKDVLEQIQFAKYALLPLKVDLISGTIREAIYAGLPVVTTITDGTPLLNGKRESILLSDQNDLRGMADNMIKLIEYPDLCRKLAQNALIAVKERYCNATLMRQLTVAYNAIIDHHINNTPIPTEIGVQNPNNSHAQQS